jgi:two-component system OmpR family sensor kinase
VVTAERGRLSRPPLSLLYPNRWPVRWRLAAVSASLTMVILVGFAFIVGQLASDKLESNFREELQSFANALANQLEVTPVVGGVEVTPRSTEIIAPPGDAAWRVVDGGGDPIQYSPNAPNVGPPRRDVHTVGRYDVASQAIPTPPTIPPTPSVFVQYARSRESLEATIDRLWLFLGGGVIGGTLLATLAGLAVAGRAMRPIAGLTAAAREIAATRDPSRRLPMPQNDDEVAELARTLEQMLRELDAARSETEQMVQVQREFIADASHELRTPLTSILANLELVQERLAARGDDAEAEEIVASALGSSRRMRRLVSDLLLLARADAGRSGPRRKCDLAKIADEALAEVRPVTGSHLVALETDGPVLLHANPDDLHRVALNLVENAVRHTPAGTRVMVSVHRRDGDAVLEVTDDGPGLPPGAGDAIFSRFVRGAGPADTSTEGGTGLGLAIVKAVATAHGGSVKAGASAAGGARFTVRLPGAFHERSLTERARDANKLAG